MNLDLDLQLAIDDPAGLPSEEELRRWAARAIEGRRESASMTLRIVDERESAELNGEYRGKPGPTNVLSFPFEAPPQVEMDLIGDIVVCAPVVAREAEEQGKPLAAHWAHMVVHGCLHLLGYDHMDPEEAEVMEKLETEILAGLGYGNPYVSDE